MNWFNKSVRWLVFLVAVTVMLTGFTTLVMAKSTDKDVSGRVVIYTSMYEDIIEAIDRTLNKRFPNIDVVFFYGGTGTLQAKVAAEIASGKLGCDMMMIAEPSYSLELKEAGILHKYLSPERDNLAFEYDPEGYWYPVRNLNMVLAYNPEKYSLDEIPTSLYGFAYDERVKGYVSMSNPLTSGTAMAAVSALRDKYGYEYFVALGNQNVMIESGSVALTKLETGECKVIMILEESVLKKREEEDSLLTVIYPDDGTIMIPSTIMTVSGDMSANNNTKACEVITDWFLSEEGQAAIVDGWMHSVLKDYGKLPYDAIPTTEILKNAMPVNWESTYREREEIRTKFEESVKR
ncbi:MAG: ABC transporter substrate-binding protein [Firmicutes bacterium]|nr:ABC transporter substrate-binding protein [Bacillota bacterium]